MYWGVSMQVRVGTVFYLHPVLRVQATITTTRLTRGLSIYL